MILFVLRIVRLPDRKPRCHGRWPSLRHQEARTPAVSRWIEDTTGWSIRKFVKTLRRYRTIQIQAGDHTVTAAAPLPADIHQTLEAIKTQATDVFSPAFR